MKEILLPLLVKALISGVPMGVAFGLLSLFTRNLKLIALIACVVWLISIGFIPMSWVNGLLH